MIKNQWIFSKWADVLVLLLPVWITWLAAFLLPQELLRTELPLWGWVIFILMLDVSHVWSTIYRTYLDKQERKAHKTVLIGAPLVAFVALMAINLVWPNYFWRIMAYYALYHFVKQQYGFMMIYAAKLRVEGKRWLNEKFMIYLSMAYPVLYWHMASERAFCWFQQGDFINLNAVFAYFPAGSEATIWTIGNIVYWSLLLAWAIQEVNLYKKQGQKIPWAKILWLLTTAGNWYLGIVYFNSDIVFSVTNVVAHGVAYLALVFFYVEKKRLVVERKPRWNISKAVWNISLMLIGIMALAYFEEYFWDGLVNREKSDTFEFLFAFPFREASSYIEVALAVSLLSLPQVTHYILDGFIWKNSSNNPFLRSVLFDKLH